MQPTDTKTKMSALRSSLFGAIRRVLQILTAEDVGAVVSATIVPTDHTATAAAVAGCRLIRLAEAGAAPASVWISVGAAGGGGRAD